MYKRRHHYIWQFYLKGWENEGKLACLRNDKVFSVNTLNVAVERDFYKIKSLSERDLYVINKIIIDKSPPLLKKILTQMLNMYMFPDIIAKHKAFNGNFELLDSMKTNLLEDYHSEIETTAIQYLNKLRHEDLSFYDNKNEKYEFHFYLGVQYFRTKQFKDRMENLFKNDDVVKNTDIPEIMENIWGISALLFAALFGNGLSEVNNKMKLVLLKNSTDEEFITGDQPLVNIKADTDDTTKPPDEVELYYPLTARLAILLKQENDSTTEIKVLNDKNVVKEYNDFIVKNSFEQLFATSINILEKYSKK